MSRRNFSSPISLLIREFYTFNEDDYLLALNEIVERYNKNPINEIGNKVKMSYKYSQATDKILKEIQN